MPSDHPVSLSFRAYEMIAKQKWTEQKNEAIVNYPKMKDLFFVIEKYLPSGYFNYSLWMIELAHQRQQCTKCNRLVPVGEVMGYCSISDQELCIVHLFSDCQLSEADRKTVNQFIVNKKYYV